MALKTVILQLICPDRPGLVSRLAGWIASHNGNILHADHHTDQGAGMFLSRLEWDLNGFNLKREAISKEIFGLARSLEGEAQLHFSDEIPRVAIFVSKQSHCLIDLLCRVNSEEIRMMVPLVISNHKNLKHICEQYNVTFKHIPVNQDNRLTSEI